MEYLLNSEEMRSCDRRTEEVFGVLKIPREEYEVLFNKYKNALAELGSYEI